MKLRLAALPFAVLALSVPLPAVRAAGDAAAEGEVLVTFRAGLPTVGARTALGRHSMQMAEHYDWISWKRQRVSGLVRDKGRTTAQLVAALQADPDVASVEPNFIRRISATTPNDTDFTKLWGLENTGQTVNGAASTLGVDTRFLPAWKLARPPGGEVVVGVVDTGVDTTHPDLAPNIWTNPGEIAGNGLDDDGNGYADDVHGYDFAAGSAAVHDSGDHGTHVAGTIAAVGRNGTGMIGLQYKARILPLQVSADGDTMYASAVLAAFNYAIALKQRGVNLAALNASFGGSSYSTTELNAIQALRDAGILLCAAAGNSATNNDSSPVYPAAYPTENIISVAALTQTNGLASFSNFGATSVDLAAPGENIYSTMPLAALAATISVRVGSATYSAAEISFSGLTPSVGLSRTIYSCGLGNAGQFPAGVSGNIALIQRGTTTFAAKITNAMAAGAVAAIIYDNTTGALGSGNRWTLGASGSWIPAVQVTQATGEAILAQLTATGTVTDWRDTALAYQFMDGTSMATPHVTGAVAFAALNFPSETFAQRKARILGHVTPVAALAGKTSSGGRLNLLALLDTDSDGLPDWWETDHFGSLAQSPGADPDGDGFNNLLEFLAATSPASSASHLAFSRAAPAQDISGRHFVLAFPSVEDRAYQVEWTSTLPDGGWSVLGGTVIGTGGTIQVVDPNALDNASRRFYRLRMLGE